MRIKDILGDLAVITQNPLRELYFCDGEELERGPGAFQLPTATSTHQPLGRLLGARRRTPSNMWAGGALSRSAIHPATKPERAHGGSRPSLSTESGDKLYLTEKTHLLH